MTALGGLNDRVLLVDKPAGVTSFAVVQHVRRAGRVAKAGHCGSLDPPATGLVVVCTGAATRVAGLFVEQPKEYAGRVRFGRATETYDAAGQTIAEAPVPALDRAMLETALGRFVGEIAQVPPMVSALKVEGRRLYEWARRGVEIERAARPVMIYGIDLLDFGADWADLRVRCGRGCYIRSLAFDLGVALGVPAHLESLRRHAIGALRVESALAPEGFAAVAMPHPAVFEVADALSFLPAAKVRAAAEAAVRNGTQPLPHHLQSKVIAPGRHRLLSEDGQRLLAIAVAGPAASGPLQLETVFPSPLPASPGSEHQSFASVDAGSGSSLESHP